MHLRLHTQPILQPFNLQFSVSLLKNCIFIDQVLNIDSEAPLFFLETAAFRSLWRPEGSAARS